MWPLIDRLGRPTLTRRATSCALEVNEQALRCLGDGAVERQDGLDDLLEAGEACWRVFRPALAKSRWRRVKDALELQSRLGPEAHQQMGSKSRRQLQRALQQQSAWLGELSETPPAEAALLDGLAGLYRKARRSYRRNPHGARARRHARRWLLAEELLLTTVGHRSADVCDRAAIRLESLGAEVFAASAAAYRRALPWRVFLALLPQPEPVAVLLEAGSGAG